MIKILGLDIGISSIGWSLVEVEEQIQGKGNIIASGVRLFTRAENPEDGKSLALPRRELRGARRANKRKKARVKQIKILLSKYLNIDLKDIIPENESLPDIFTTTKAFLSPWELRSEGLDRKLDDKEFFRVLLHIAKRRGYNDCMQSQKDEKENKIILKSIKSNRDEMQRLGYRSVGEMMCKEYFLKERCKGEFKGVRNKAKDSKDGYQHSVGRRDLQEEVKILFDSQRSFGNQKATQELEELFNKIAFYQRDLKSFESMVGKCQFYSEEKRASKCCYSAEEFINLTKIINTLAYIGEITKEVFSQEMIELILNKAKSLKTGVSYRELRKILKLENYPSIVFKDNALDYTQKDTEKKIFISFPKFHKLKEYLSDFEEEFNALEVQTLDEIANIIAFNRSEKTIKEKISKLPISKSMQEKLSLNQLGFDKTLALSLKAIYKISPLMKEGKRYDEAIELSGLLELCTKNVKKGLLPPLAQTDFADTLNPVVNRAISQYRKVVNAVIKKYGRLHKIHIEFTRDVGKSFNDRQKIKKEQDANRKLNDEAKNLCQEFGLEVNGRNILKVKLWKRQDEFCIYSGKKIEIEDLKEENKLQVDHIYPLSRSLDDSQNNKVLVFTAQNQLKRNKTPYEWIGSDEAKWEELRKRINAISKLPRNVKKKIMNTAFIDKNIGSRGEFLTRNLVDTGYINRLVSQYTSQYLEFLPLDISEDTSIQAGSKGSKKHILTMSGGLTSILRHYWGLDSKNRETHLHHFQDSLIIALATDANIKSLSNYLKSKEERYRDSKEKAKEIYENTQKFKKPSIEPLEDFRSKLEAATKTIFVSRASRRNVTGALHEQTIRKRTEYYASYGREEGVKKAIELGKIREINGGIVDNGEMIRTDIFRSKDKGKYYVIPIYTYDFAIGRLPNKAIVQGKDKSGVIKDWLEMDENYEFCFSLFKDDLVQIQQKGMDKSIYAYYVGASSSTGTLSFRHHSNLVSSDEKEFFKEKSSGFLAESCGIQNLKIFKKCIVSVLGEISEAPLEPRRDVRLKTTKKRS
ncbi:type II CRISPR RNA-guided endonuclease Cas9 [Helicobacter cappadocius]|uniref:CRISPR-associated endonuclease Cas9 n=1 Tax=Helicobacter cappadocius TaxID=3063998 RepID=A0AA90PJI3_9HELI|nr:MULTISPECIES: type II CRISPR RNA-guided endonuclease Cas9 [unclassified Helicobacter]MDO7252477.1 type II CRISPR RNA-guided endonuclease Cas9 [Helicobacter sp. faydin-H75]MDP2538344.1 type II CRISPR RNA-guided endonuclease Cas9 [Helicobacter sp. faydin-H76]